MDLGSQKLSVVMSVHKRDINRDADRKRLSATGAATRQRPAAELGVTGATVCVGWRTGWWRNNRREQPASVSDIRVII